MNKRIELIQAIGNEICEGCGPDRDCGLKFDGCDRIFIALSILDGFLHKENSTISNTSRGGFTDIKDVQDE